MLYYLSITDYIMNQQPNFAFLNSSILVAKNILININTISYGVIYEK